MIKSGAWIGLVLMLVCASGCGTGGSPTVTYRLGALLSVEDFGADSTWQRYVQPSQKVDFQIIDGFYRARAWDGGLMWTLDAALHSDVVIEVETRQLSQFRNNAYGILCRASPTDNGDGYYFLISGDGQIGIRRGAQRQIAPLVHFRSHPAVRQEAGAINRLRVVCLGDYLALYVNDQFAAETRDPLFRSGYAGITASVVAGGDVDVIFDDLRISEARPAR